jgi:hypothetical protein
MTAKWSKSDGHLLKSQILTAAAQSEDILQPIPKFPTYNILARALCRRSVQALVPVWDPPVSAFSLLYAGQFKGEKPALFRK